MARVGKAYEKNTESSEESEAMAKKVTALCRLNLHCWVHPSVVHVCHVMFLLLTGHLYLELCVCVFLASHVSHASVESFSVLPCHVCFWQAMFSFSVWHPKGKTGLSAEDSEWGVSGHHRPPFSASPHHRWGAGGGWGNPAASPSPSPSSHSCRTLLRPVLPAHQCLLLVCNPLQAEGAADAEGQQPEESYQTDHRTHWERSERRCRRHVQSNMEQGDRD